MKPIAVTDLDRAELLQLIGDEWNGLVVDEVDLRRARWRVANMRTSVALDAAAKAPPGAAALKADGAYHRARATEDRLWRELETSLDQARDRRRGPSNPSPGA